MKNPPEDGSSVHLQLVEIIEKTPVPSSETFSITISSVAPEDGRLLIEQLKKDLFQLHGEVRFTCENSIVCESIAKSVRERKRIKMQFSHAKKSDISFVVRKVIRTEPMRCL